MQSRPRRPQFPTRPASSGANVTAAVGMEETAGRLRARRNSLFTQTIMWITGLVCTAFLLGSLAQAWSNHQLKQTLQEEQQSLQQLQAESTKLAQAVEYSKDPAVIEQEARQKLGYIRPGENAVVIISGVSQQTEQKQTSKQTQVQQSFWHQWWNIFFDH